MVDLQPVIRQFAFEGQYEEAVPYGNGHINDTVALRFRRPDGTSQRYILQRINQYVFHKPEEVMENIQRVTSHLRDKIQAAGGDPTRETLTIIPTLDGRAGCWSTDGDYWRAYLFIEGTRTYEAAETLEQVYQTAWSFGNFLRLLEDFPAGQLHETIPNFHNTPKRFGDFQTALARDAKGRVAQVRAEIEFLLARQPDTVILTGKLAAGELPLRVTHNDTKINNLLVDDTSGKGLCIVDLDTIMPGLALYDFGDAVRTAAALGAEDEPDISKVGLSLPVFDALAHGYLEAAREILTPAEIDLLAFSARLITLEQAYRFLGDYLNGDVYYKIHRPDHNLDRARTQIKLLQELEAHYSEMQEIVARYR